MFTLEDAADYIASLSIVDSDHIWIGKLQDKVNQSIGVYPLKRNTPVRIPIGGADNTDHDVRPISILIHWSDNVLLTDEAAYNLFEVLRDTKDVTINNKKIKIFEVKKNC